MTNKIDQFASTMMNSYPLPVRTFGLAADMIGTQEWLFRRLITNIMVSRSLEENAIAAAEEIFSIWPTCYDLAEASPDEIAAIMNKNKVRFSNPKNKYVINAAQIISTVHNGEVPQDRKALEAIDGVGDHVASVVLALGFNVPAFAVDLHVRRIAKRVGLVDEKDSDRLLAKKLMAMVPQSQWGAFSRAFVDLGKDSCGAVANCSQCKMDCSARVETKSIPETKARLEKIGDGVYEVVAGSSNLTYKVTVKGDKVSCNCKGYRFRRTCSHVTEVTR